MNKNTRKFWAFKNKNVFVNVSESRELSFKNSINEIIRINYYLDSTFYLCHIMCIPNRMHFTEHAF